MTCLYRQRQSETTAGDRETHDRPLQKVTEKCLQDKMPGKDVTTMNKVILMGRLTKNPEIKYAGKDNDMAVEMERCQLPDGNERKKNSGR